MSPHNNIAEIDGLGDKTAKRLIWNARNSLGMTEFIAAEDIDENTEYIHTGSSELNRILVGGFQTGKLTEVYVPITPLKLKSPQPRRELSPRLLKRREVVESA